LWNDGAGGEAGAEEGEEERVSRSRAVAALGRGLLAEAILGAVGTAVGVLACLAGLGPRDGWLSWSLLFGAAGALVGLPFGVLAVGRHVVAARRADLLVGRPAPTKTTRGRKPK
jgi:hypothetical protein